MTVLARSLNLVYCTWADGGSVQYGTYAVDALRRVQATESPQDVDSDAPRETM